MELYQNQSKEFEDDGFHPVDIVEMENPADTEPELGIEDEPPEVPQGSANMATDTDLTGTASEEDLIGQTVRHINRVRSTSDNASETIGQLVLEKFFGNDLLQASSKNPGKGQAGGSYRKLCRHPDLKVSAPELSRMVRVAAQNRAMSGIDLSRFSYSHKVALLKLADEQKAQFVEHVLGLERFPSTRELIKLVRDRMVGDPGQDDHLGRVLKHLGGLRAKLEKTGGLIGSADARIWADENLRSEVSSVIAKAREVIEGLEAVTASSGQDNTSE